MLHSKDDSIRKPYNEDTLLSPKRNILKDLYQPMSDQKAESMSESNKFFMADQKPGVTKHAYSVIDKHQERLKKYGSNLGSKEEVNSHNFKR